MAYTPRYASPEQKAGQRVGTATDIFGLGLLLAELLDAPWPDGQSPELESLPDELAAIIDCATRTDPAQRYPHVDLFAADLRHYLAGEVVQARRATPTYLARKWLQRHWVAGGVALAFLTTVGGFSWQMRQERDAALAAERTAQAVRDYMVSVFQGADPELAGQRDLPVSHFLDAGAGRLQESLREQPRTRAEMAGILGGVYQSIGLRGRALALYDQSIGLARAERMPALLADSLYRKAYTLYDMDALVDALPVAREALTVHEQIAPGSHAHLASLRLLGSVLGYSGDTTEAPQRLQQALALATASEGPDSVEAGLAHQDLARYQAVAGEPAAVLEHAIRAGEIFTATLGEAHIRVADALEMRILGLAQLERSAEAVPLTQTLVERRTALYGEWSVLAGGQFIAHMVSFAPFERHPIDHWDGPMARLRAIAFGVPTVRAGNRSFSGWIDANGRVRSQSARFGHAARCEALWSPGGAPTPYTHVAGRAAGLPATLVLGALLLASVQRRRSAHNPQASRQHPRQNPVDDAPLRRHS